MNASSGPVPSIASVVIPAHNEEQTIAACLRAILASADPGDLDIVVVANGCHDRTAEVARSVHPDVRVVEIRKGSKALALNAGDEVARGFPRLFIDADIEISTEAVRATAEALRSDSVLAAAPKIRIDSSGRPWRVRAYYDIWTRLPYVRESHIGSGVYALSESGRARFDRFPVIISDDLYIRDLFDAHERITLKEHEFVDRVPSSLAAIIRIKARAAAGKRQYARAFPESAQRARATQTSIPSGIWGVAQHPTNWPALLIYSTVYVLSQIRGWWKFRFGDLTYWDRDDSARASIAP